LKKRTQLVNVHSVHVPGTLTVLGSLHFKFITIVNKNTEDESIRNGRFYVLHNTHYKFSPHHIS
jgi:hypothetical protein